MFIAHPVKVKRVEVVQYPSDSTANVYSKVSRSHRFEPRSFWNTSIFESKTNWRIFSFALDACLSKICCWCHLGNKPKLAFQGPISNQHMERTGESRRQDINDDICFCFTSKKKNDQMKVLKLCTSRGFLKTKNDISKSSAFSASTKSSDPKVPGLFFDMLPAAFFGLVGITVAMASWKNLRSAELLFFSNCACHCDPTLT